MNKFSGALDANPWTKDYWLRALKTLEIRPRKFYVIRHTFIIEVVKRGEILKAIADYVGSPVQIIDEQHCGTLTLSDQTVIKPRHSMFVNLLASPTGFEPHPQKKAQGKKGQ